MPRKLKFHEQKLLKKCVANHKNQRQNPTTNANPL